VPARIAASTGAGEDLAFITAIASPRLSAALTLWCMTEWAAGDTECLAFRLSAARLQLVQPWLFAGGAPPDVLATEVASQAEILLPSNDQAMAARTWVELVRAGEALPILAVALESRSAQELWNKAEAGWLDPSDVVWVHGRFAIPLRRMRREAGVNIEVRFVGESMARKYKGDRIVPIRELVERNVLELPPAACKQVLSLISAARKIHAPVRDNTNTARGVWADTA
jgi:hypothetical protein